MHFLKPNRIEYFLLVAVFVGVLVSGQTSFANMPDTPAKKPLSEEFVIEQDIDRIFEEFKPTYLKKPSTELTRRRIRPDFSNRENLSSKNKSLYREIFDLQTSSRWEEADALIKQLSDHRLMGYVLFQRYMHPRGYRSRFAELKDWLEIYNDHAGADEIFELAMARKADAAKAPLKSAVKTGFHAINPTFSRVGQTYKSTKRRSTSQYKRSNEIKKAVKKDLSCCGAATRALGRLTTKEAKQVLDAGEIDILKGHIANTYFYLKRPEKALRTASEAVERSNTKTPLAAWIAGLVSWQKGNFEEAARFFEISASSPYTSEWKRSASAFWASRAFLRIRQPQKVNYWLQKAAKEPRTFYGLIARRALAAQFHDLNWGLPKLEQRHLNIIHSYDSGFRAHLLLQVGQRVLAEQELMQINPRKKDGAYEALMAFASHHKLPAILLKTSTIKKDNNDHYYDEGLFPTGLWDRTANHTVDWALVHALIKQESRFDPFARSPRGAAGLMQILPSTASQLTGEVMNGRDRYKLLDPDRNVQIGDEYLKWLMSIDYIDRNLFKTVIAYNAGPGNLRRWMKELDYNDDPLFFIESIPVSETRNFVEKVMLNYWIYRLRFAQPTPSLTQVSSGYWPLYQSFD